MARYYTLYIHKCAALHNTVHCSNLLYIHKCAALHHTVHCSNLLYIHKCAALHHTVHCSNLLYIHKCSQMSNSCVCCCHVSGAVRVFIQVHPHGRGVPCLITQFVNLYAKTLSFFLNILPKDNPTPEFYNYLVHCQIL
jgi:hypothetical protein